MNGKNPTPLCSYECMNMQMYPNEQKLSKQWRFWSITTKQNCLIFLENLKIPGSKQYPLLVNVQCLDDLLYQQLPVQSVPANTHIVYKWIMNYTKGGVGLDSHCTTKPEALEKCRWESGTYLIAASSVLLSSVIESVGSRKKKENQNQISRNQVSEFKSIHYHHDQSYCV